MKTKIRVIYVASWYNNIYRDLFDILRKEVDLTVVYSEQYPPPKKNYNYKIKLLPTKRIDKLIYLSKNTPNVYPLYTKKLKQLIKHTKPDIVITNLIYLPSTAQISKWCSELKIPFVLQTEIKMHPKTFLEKILFKVYHTTYLRKVLDRTTKIVPWISDSERFLINEYNIPKNKIETIPPGINTKIFKPIKTKKESTTLNILMIARFVKYKNHKMAIQLASMLKQEGFQFHLTFIGQGNLKKEIKRIVLDEKLDKEVTVLEQIPPENIPLLINKQDLLILTSTNEAIGLVVPETMACGIPVLISDSTGATTYLNKNLKNSIYKTGDIKDMKQKLVKMQDKLYRETLGQESYNHIVKNYTREKIGQTYIQMLEDVLK